MKKSRKAEAFLLLHTFVFLSRGKTTPDVPLLLVPVQDFPDLGIEGWIVRGEFLTNVLVDRRF